jgi:hypothetical protein
MDIYSSNTKYMNSFLPNKFIPLLSSPVTPGHLVEPVTWPNLNILIRSFEESLSGTNQSKLELMSCNKINEREVSPMNVEVRVLHSNVAAPEPKITEIGDFLHSIPDSSTPHMNLDPPIFQYFVKLRHNCLKVHLDAEHGET